MIFGMGMDMVDARRLVRPLTRNAQRFLERILTPTEIINLTNKMEKVKESPENEDYIKRLAVHVAKYFAAKEACAKAMGTGFRGGVSFKDMAVSRDALGKPVIELFGKTLEILKNRAPNGKHVHLHLSLCDEYPYAQAQVIIEII